MHGLDPGQFTTSTFRQAGKTAGRKNSVVHQTKK